MLSSRHVVVPALVSACSLLAACSTNSYCLADQDYQKAQVVPELRSAEGLELPESPSALRLPPPPSKPEPFGVRTADGTGLCLDKPPAMSQPPVDPAMKPAKS
jgi:hypothetical protein